MSQRKGVAIGALAELYGRKLSVASVKLFVMAAAGLTDEQFECAAGSMAQKSKFMPTPAELIELARNDGVSYEAKATLAFEELDEALTRNKPSLMSPLVAAVARQLGGFQCLREMPLKEFATWKRKDFLAAYLAIAKESPERLLAISGPRSELARALAADIKKIPSREDIAKEEVANRKKLQALPQLKP